MDKNEIMIYQTKDSKTHLDIKKKENIVKLKDISELLNGFTFKSSNYANSGYRVIRITNVQKGILIDDNPKFYAPTNSLKKYELKVGDILISLTGNVGRVGLVNENILPAYFNQRVCCLRIKSDQVCKEYLFHFLNNDLFENLCIQNSNGIVQLNMSIEWLKNVSINLPSLEKQKQIAKILDKIDEIRQKKKQANEKLDEFLKSYYITRFSKDTKIVKLEELCYFITKGTTPPAKDMSQKHGEIPYIKVYNLRFDTRLDFTTNPTFVTKEAHNKFLSRSIVYPNDVLMNIVGPPLCKVSIVPNTYPEWNINQAIVRFRCNKELNNLYLAWFLTTPFAEKQMLKNAKKTSGQLNLTLEICKNIEIPLPNIEQQNKFAHIFEKIEAQKQKNEQAIKEMDNLFNALSQKAFKGKL